MESTGADGLGALIEAVWAGRGCPGEELIAGFRAARVVCPLTAEGALRGADSGGVHWLFAFTSERALAVFARARGAGDERWEFARVEGGRLLDVALPAVGRPAGVAVDVASSRPMLLPPVAGVVPAETEAAVAMAGTVAR